MKIKKILVIDDDPLARSILTHILEEGGYAVETAKNGVEALKKYDEFSPMDVVISDMNMAKMNGLEFIKALRKKDMNVPIIILTVNSEMTVALEAIRTGANDYLLKDEIIQNTLLFSVDKIINKHRLEMRDRKLMEDLERKNEELERLSFLDGLTNIPNRRYFDSVLGQEWRRAVREQKPISLIMMDIDYFKRYNDIYGHQEGDRCLQQIAEALNDSLRRSSDFIARYGGEEFAAILPDTYAEGALSVAKAIRLNIMELGIPHEGSDISDHITLSLGIGTGLPSAHDTVNSLLLLADQALYDAKKSGRNQINLKLFDTGERRDGTGYKNPCGG